MRQSKTALNETILIGKSFPFDLMRHWRRWRDDNHSACLLHRLLSSILICCHGRNEYFKRSEEAHHGTRGRRADGINGDCLWRWRGRQGNESSFTHQPRFNESEELYDVSKLATRDVIDQKKRFSHAARKTLSVTRDKWKSFVTFVKLISSLLKPVCLPRACHWIKAITSTELASRNALWAFRFFMVLGSVVNGWKLFLLESEALDAMLYCLWYKHRSTLSRLERLETI